MVPFCLVLNAQNVGSILTQPLRSQQLLAIRPPSLGDQKPDVESVTPQSSETLSQGDDRSPIESMNAAFMGSDTIKISSEEAEFFGAITSIDGLLEEYLFWNLSGDDLPDELRRELHIRRCQRREASPYWFALCDFILWRRDHTAHE